MSAHDEPEFETLSNGTLWHKAVVRVHPDMTNEEKQCLASAIIHGLSGADVEWCTDPAVGTAANTDYITVSYVPDPDVIAVQGAPFEGVRIDREFPLGDDT